MVESGGLENRCTRKGTGGSNPSPSESREAGEENIKRKTLRWSVLYLRRDSNARRRPGARLRADAEGLPKGKNRVRDFLTDTLHLPLLVLD